MLLPNSADEVLAGGGKLEAVDNANNRDPLDGNKLAEVGPDLPQDDLAVGRARGHQVCVPEGGHRRDPVALTVRRIHHHRRLLLDDAPEAQ